MVFGPSGVAVALVLRSKTERAIHMWDPMGLPSTCDPICSLVQGAASSLGFPFGIRTSPFYAGEDVDDDDGT